MSQKIRSFTDLDVWKKSYELCRFIYKIQINNKNIADQIQRSSLSICSNIAEGFGRQSNKDKKHYYVMARGSLYETQNQIILLCDLKIISKEQFDYLADLTTQVTKLTNSLIKTIK